jgi:MerR family transcriptional regulator, copper efflux regulator
MSPMMWTRTCATLDPYLDTVVVRFAAMQTYSVSQAAARTGWSPRMLRYLESTGLVVPERSASGYRRYAEPDLGLLRGLTELRVRFGVELSDVAFVVRLRRDPVLRGAVEAWLTGATVPAEGASEADWIEWEQRKQERLLAA